MVFEVENSRKEYRSRLEIIRDVLAVADGAGDDGSKKTHIMYGANLSYKLLTKYLGEVLDARLVCAQGACYLLTEKGRNFLQRTEKAFDVINISMLDSYSASAAGLYALNESHLYTIEAIEQAFDRLRAGGLLSITRVLKTPPRDCLKIFATVAEVLRRNKIANPAEHIMMIRSYSAAVIVASPQRNN